MGIYQNEPKIFINHQGKPAGFWVEILDTIAQKEQWDLVYVPCEWQNCLRSLQAGDLDLMPDVAYTAKREKDFDFNDKPVLASWSEVYVNPGVIVNSFLDLDQKRISVLAGSAQEGDFSKRAQAFGLKLDLVETSDFQEVFEQVSSGAVDAGLVNVYYARWNARKYKVLPTNLVFNPAQLYFAVPKGDPQSLIPPLDRNLWALMQERDSPYYQALDRWLSPPTSFRSSLRVLWLPLSVSASTIGVVVFAIWAWGLRQEIRRRRGVEAQLSVSEQRYASLITALPVGIFRANAQGENIYTNDRCCEILGLTPEQSLGNGWAEAIHPEDRGQVWREWTKAHAENRPFQREYRFLKPDGQVAWVYGQAVPERDSSGEICGYVGSVTDISDRKWAEEKLKQQEGRLRLAMQSAGMICWEYNSKTCEVQYWGRYTASGWQPESWQSSLDSFYQEIHPEDRGRVQIAFTLALNNQGTLNIQYRLLLPDHESIWLLSLGQVQKNAHELSMIGISLDITAQKTIEEKLRDSEQRLRRAVENAPFPIMIHAEDGEILQINGVWTSITGYTLADIPTTKHWAALAYGDRAEAALENTAESYRLESRIDKGDWMIRTRDGEDRIWHFHVAPLGLLPDGRRFVISMAIDITHRRQAEKALREREAFLREMTNNIPGTVIQYVLHPDGSDRVDYIGPGCINLWELSPEQIVQDSSLLWSAIHPEDSSTLYASILASAETLMPWLAEWRITTAVTGTKKWVQGRGNPHRLDNGDVIWTSVLVDISDRKQVELALVEAKEEAEQASYYKTSFLAIMSHEIRTPMNGVLGMLDLLAKTPLTDNQCSYLRMAQFSAESLLGLINDILDFSKIEAGKMEVEQIEFDLLHELENIVQTMAPMAYEKGLEFIFEINYLPAVRVLGDPRRIRQVLINLLSNAIKFTAEGFILLRSHLQSQPDPEEPDRDRLQLTIVVEDTGMGIPADKLDTLFDAFTQVDVSTTRKYGGSGLGLAIVRQLCALMEGSIQVQSAIDRGSCFKFTVPLGTTATLLPALPDRPLQGLRILLMEGHDRLCQTLAQQLQGWGATVLSFSNLQDAQEFFRTASHPASHPVPDLVIFDEHLTDLNAMIGEQLLNTSRQPQALWEVAPGEKPVPMIIMTTVSDRLSAPAEHLENYFYLLKPITPNQLINVLGQVCQTLSFAISPPLNTPLPGAIVSSGQVWSAMRLLVVEDSSINQSVIQGFLDVLGLEADCVDSGKAALAILKQTTQTPYSLILMDCQMPELDGYETTQYIRQGQAGTQYQQVPIIALTAHAMPGDREKCLAAGMNDYLTKPLTLRDLKATLQQWLNPFPPAAPPDRPIPSDGSPPLSDQPQSSSLDPSFNSVVPPALKSTGSDPPIPLFDPEGLLDRTEGERDLAAMMCQRFLEGIPQTLQELKAIVLVEDSTAIELINLADVERYAHRLKGSASLIGAEAFRYQAAQLEERSKQNDPMLLPEIIEMSQALWALFEQTQGEIDRWIS